MSCMYKPHHEADSISASATATQHANGCVVVQANTVPATFWALAFLLLPENAHHKQQILSSLQCPGSPDCMQAPLAQQQGWNDAGEPCLNICLTAPGNTCCTPRDDSGCTCLGVSFAVNLYRPHHLLVLLGNPGWGMPEDTSCE